MSKEKNTKSAAAGKKKTQWQTNDNDFARKYRPKKVSEIIGQSIIKYNIKGWARQKKVPGAILIHGQLGSGKTTSARVITALLNCQDLDMDNEPCGVCASCATLFGANVKNPDYIEINCASNTSVDDVRSLRSRISMLPRYNRLVVALDEVHKLSKAGQEALLKMVEEPSNHVTYILLTTDKQGLIPTLVSRCTKLQVQELRTKDNVELMQRVCKAEGLDLDTDILEMIATRSDNIPRDCLVNLQSVSSILASGEVSKKDVTVEGIGAKLAEVLGVPNYVSVQNFLTNVYMGKLSSALSVLQNIQSKPIFVRWCLDTHANVIMSLSSKTPEKIIREKWVLMYTSKMIKESGLVREADVLKNMAALTADLVDVHKTMSEYQLGDSIAPVVGFATKWCMRMKSE